MAAKRLASKTAAVGKGLFKSAWENLDAALDGGLTSRFDSNVARLREREELGRGFHAWNVALYGAHLAALWWWLDTIDKEMNERIASERGEKGGKGGGGQDGNSPLKRLPASRMKYIEDSGGKEPSPIALKEELHSSQAPGPSHGGFSSLLQFVHTKLGQYVASAEEGQGADEARLQPEGSPR